MKERWLKLPSLSRSLLTAFVLINILFGIDGGTNAYSRLATLCAMVEDGSFRIDPYKDWTLDWSRTPDGHYYSNKAPGPMLMGAPLFWIFDKVTTMGIMERVERDARRASLRSVSLPILSILLQALPWALLAFWTVELLPRVVHAPFLLAFLFGNTATLFMNTFFGHGFSAVWTYVAVFALWRRKYGWAGFAMGWALLGDYALALAVPMLFLSAILQQSPVGRFRRMFIIATGALFPAALWILYHQTSFGGVLSLPQKFQNPIFVDVTLSSRNLWGVLGAPQPDVLGQILFGWKRGVLWTQPWVLWVLGSLVLRWKRIPERETLFFILCAFTSLLLSNSGFGGWHGGSSPGPRYLSSILPAFALVLVWIWPFISNNWKRTAHILLVPSLLFYIVVYSSLAVATASEILWVGYVEQLLSRPLNLVRFFFFLAVAGTVFHKYRREILSA